MQKSKEVCKNRKSNKNFHCNKKKKPDKNRKNNKNDNQAKVQTYKEKGKEGPKEVRKFPKNRKSNKNILLQ